MMSIAYSSVLLMENTRSTGKPLMK